MQTTKKFRKERERKSRELVVEPVHITTPHRITCGGKEKDK